MIVVSCYFRPLEGTPAPGEVRLIHITPNFVSTFPVQVFAFTCAQNVSVFSRALAHFQALKPDFLQLFPVYNELSSNTQSRMNIIIGSSIGSATLTYEVIAVFGYLTFGSKVGANVIAMYPSTTLFVAVGQLAIVVLVLFSYPLQVFPCRNCLDKVFHAGDTHIPKRLPQSEEEDDEDDGFEDENHIPPDMTPLKHAVLTTGIISGGFLIAYFVDDLKMGKL